MNITDSRHYVVYAQNEQDGDFYFFAGPFQSAHALEKAKVKAQNSGRLFSVEAFWEIKDIAQRVPYTLSAFYREMN